jgi:hypothetical protein
MEDGEMEGTDEERPQMDEEWMEEGEREEEEEEEGGGRGGRGASKREEARRRYLRMHKLPLSPALVIGSGLHLLCHLKRNCKSRKGKREMETRVKVASKKKKA